MFIICSKYTMHTPFLTAPCPPSPLTLRKAHSYTYFKHVTCVIRTCQQKEIMPIAYDTMPRLLNIGLIVTIHTASSL